MEGKFAVKRYGRFFCRLTSHQLCIQTGQGRKRIHKAFRSRQRSKKYQFLCRAITGLAGGSSYSFTTILSDTRIYRPINSRDVLAAQLLGQFNTGNVPFNQLALLGGESIMRGYYLGRFRDNNQIATQVEYRFLPLPLGFTKRWGAALFAGTGTVFPNVRSLSVNNWVWSAGGGVRFLLFPKKDIFTRLDVAFTQEGPGFYIFIGEAF